MGKEHTPSMATIRWEGLQRYSYFPWEAGNLTSTLGTPALGPVQERWHLPKKHLALKDNKEYIQKNYRVSGNKNPTFNIPMSRLDPNNSTKHQIEKHMDHRWVGTHLLILKQVLERRTSRDSHWVQRQSVSRISFAILRYLADISTSKCHLEFHL